MTERLIEIVKIDKRYGKNKSKYKVGDIITDMEKSDDDNNNAIFKVIKVYKSNNSNYNHTLYDIEDLETHDIFYGVTTTEIGEIVNSKYRRFKGTYMLPFLNKNTKIYDIEKMLGYKKGSVVKYLNRKLMTFDKLNKYIESLEREYMVKNKY